MPHPRSTAESSALSVMLREAAADNHHGAERTPFMRRFFRSEITKDAYTAYLTRFWFVYSALESVGERLKDDPVVGRMYTPALLRRPRLEADLDFYAGKGWKDSATPSPVTEKYVERIRWTGSEFPPGWVAHSWVRYLGMVGGQEVLRRIVTKAYGLVDDGMEFYKFPELAEIRPFFADFHERLDSMPLSEDDKRRVADEGNVAFQFNIDLTDELAADFGIDAPPGPADEMERLKTQT